MANHLLWHRCVWIWLLLAILTCKECLFKTVKKFLGFLKKKKYIWEWHIMVQLSMEWITQLLHFIRIEINNYNFWSVILWTFIAEDVEWYEKYTFLYTIGSAISNYMYLIIIHDVFMIQVRNTTDVAKKNFKSCLNFSI